MLLHFSHPAAQLFHHCLTLLLRYLSTAPLSWHLLSHVSWISVLLLVNSPLNSKRPSLHSSKKPTLDKENLANYRPISNLSAVSKVTVHIVKSHLIDHLTQNWLFNSFQSAYRKLHSSETVLLSLHDHLINDNGCQHVTCLLSPRPLCSLRYHWPFHSLRPSFPLVWNPWHCTKLVQVIPIRLSLLRKMLHWLLSLSDSHQSCYRVPQGSVLSSLLFTLYITPLSSIISSLSLSSALFSGSSPEPAVNLSHGMFHSRLKTYLFSKSSPP